MNITFPLLTAVLAGASSLLAQVTVSIPADLDNTLFEDATGAVSNGAGPALYTGRTSLALRRALLRFDVASQLPAGAAISAVELVLNVEQSGPASAPTDLYSVHRVTSSWGEGTSNAGLPGGAGVPATNGDATWIHTSFPGSLWTTAGGDFAATPSATVAMPQFGSVTIPTSADLVNDVQSWLNASSTNAGWLIRSDDEGFAATLRARRLTSREGLAGLGPTLFVTYDIPGITTLAGTGCTPSPLPLQFAGSPTLGDTLTISPSAGSPLSLVIVGVFQTGVPLSLVFGCNCTLVPDLTLLASGSYNLVIPNVGSLVGTQLYSQGYYASVGSGFPCPFGANVSFGLSDGVEITIQS